MCFSLSTLRGMWEVFHHILVFQNVVFLSNDSNLHKWLNWKPNQPTYNNYFIDGEHFHKEIKSVIYLYLFVKKIQVKI